VGRQSKEREGANFVPGVSSGGENRSKGDPGRKTRSRTSPGVIGGRGYIQVSNYENQNEKATKTHSRKSQKTRVRGDSQVERLPFPTGKERGQKPRPGTEEGKRKKLANNQGESRRRKQYEKKPQAHPPKGKLGEVV